MSIGKYVAKLPYIRKKFLVTDTVDKCADCKNDFLNMFRKQVWKNIDREDHDESRSNRPHGSGHRYR